MKKAPTVDIDSSFTWSAMMGMLGVRLIAISGFLLFLSFILRTDSVAFYAFIACAYIITIPYSLWMRNQDRMRQLAPLQFLVDLVLVSGVVYFSGGIGHSFFIFLYPLIILSAGIILPPKQTVQITCLSILSYTLIAILISNKILISPDPSTHPPNLVGSAGAFLLRISIFVFFGFASTYVSKRCDYITKKEKQLRDVTQEIFKNVKAGLLLLDEKNSVLMANDRAGLLLGADPSDLIQKNLDSFHVKPSQIKSIRSDIKGASDYFRRPDGSIFPVSIEYAQLELPSEIFPETDLPTSDSLVKTRILSFYELSSFLQLQRQANQAERIRAAGNMAKEMAHQIRTPLTGISGAIQLLLLEQKKEASNRSVPKDEEALSQQIFAQTSDLNKIVQKFLDYAEFSPKSTKELVEIDIE